jgi:hypothetical protein
MQRKWRVLFTLALVTQATLGAVGTAQARTDVPLDTSGKATPADWAALGVMLGQMQATLAGAEALMSNETTNKLRWRRTECRFQSLQRGTWTDREERATTRCAVAKWLPGELSKVFQVMACESGMNRLARNGIYVGLFQHIQSAFPGRVRSFEPPTWDSELSTKWENSRSQIVMSVRMARAVGWGPWTCA